MRYFLFALMVLGLLAGAAQAKTTVVTKPNTICKVAVFSTNSNNQKESGTMDVCPADIKNNGYLGARLDPGYGAVPIDAHGTCVYLDNVSKDQSYFVPFRTAFEWRSFINGAPTNIEKSGCCVPLQTQTPCGLQIALNYGREGEAASVVTAETRVDSYTCNGGTWELQVENGVCPASSGAMAVSNSRNLKVLGWFNYNAVNPDQVNLAVSPETGEVVPNTASQGDVNFALEPNSKDNDDSADWRLKQE